ncbi:MULTISPECIES: class I SAM-dependent methyltransferase [unclassified Mycolicibacterium]|uniref:O-methyltransferase n=1 Tax=unclassified Mycolicibacterium TaxID=2636767 RepID=UPI001F4BEA6B|nr:class I SAM-dependent methyltransferase [Mycolicibacterium sp. YH-1]UNB51451.1 class I SAM-dependent methyltransferase [Mycolicibacterium sp. YH-1]
MDTLIGPLHTAIRNSRRAKGVWQTRDLSAPGQMPSAVLAGVRAALIGRHDSAEQGWIDQIEALRALLLTSPSEFQMTDYGAGTRRDGYSGAGITTTRTIGNVARASKPPRWADLLFRLVRSTGAVSLLELGSCVGISAAYQAAALELNGGEGRLISLEGVEALAERSTRTIEEIGLSHRAEIRVGEFGTTLSQAITDLEPIDFAFIDGNHDESATIAYADQLLPHLADEAVLVFDDISWSDGMVRAWQHVVNDPRYALTVDLRFVGIAVISASATTTKHLQISYS